MQGLQGLGISGLQGLKFGFGDLGPWAAVFAWG